jgi:VanZ family protein
LIARRAIPLWILLAIYWSGIFLLTHVPGPKLPVVPLSDKIEHFLAFGALGGLLYLTLWANNRARTELAFIVLLIGLSYGAFDELTQALPFVQRDCNFLDFCADSAGLSVAAVGMTLIRRGIDRVRQRRAI